MLMMGARAVALVAGLAAAVAGLGLCGAPALAAHPARTAAAHPLGHAAPNPASASQGLDVLPFPGTPDAAPATNIILPAVAPNQIATITATGTHTGTHQGSLSAQPAGQGSAFTPQHPFTAGETVTVTATLRSKKAATATGAHTKHLHWSFTIAEPATVRRHADAAWDSSAPSPSSRKPTHSFITEPDFHPPVVTMSGHDPDPAQGDIFLDAAHTGQNAAYVLNRKGDLLWYKPTAVQGSAALAADVAAQTYDGKPVVTYWQGNVTCPPCAGQGDDEILNNSYQTIHTVTAGDGYQTQGTDLHEFLVTRDKREDVAYVTIWKAVGADLRSVGGPRNGIAFDWIIQEIDIKTNKVIWEWHALPHVPVADSYSPYVPGQPYEYFHMNSIQQLPNGHLIISARDTWAVYSIDKRTGKVAWELGGKHSSFKLGPGVRFYWQHDARLHAKGLLTVFDDGASPREEKQSRALEIRLQMKRHRATLVHAYAHRPSTLAPAEGSVQILADHNVFVGWGYSPYFSEYSPAGEQLFGGSFVAPIHAYRALRAKWVGAPLQPPVVVVRPSSTSGQDEVYVSWNGATRVAKWRLLAGTSSTSLKRVKTVSWSGFETGIQTAQAQYFELQALNAKRKVLPHGTSAVVGGS
jgi:hypothetical protein